MTIHSINKTMLGTFTLSMMLAAVASAADKAPATAASQRGAVTTAPSTPAPATKSAPAATAPESTPAMPATGPGGQQHVQGMPELPSTPAAIGSIVAARPFTVLEPWTNEYRLQSTVSQGWVVVIQAPFEYVLPRQTAEPVLMAGAEGVERVMSLPEEGLILAIVPGTTASDAVPGFAAGTGTSMRPLAETAIWFGTPLPVALDDVLASQEIALAEAAGITARPQAEVAQALAKGGSAIEVADRAALFEVIRPWAVQFGIPDVSADVTPVPAK